MFPALPLFSTGAAVAETALSASPAQAVFSTEIAQTLPIPEITQTRLIFQLALSLGLGLLIGLQRESSRSGFGGVRTFRSSPFSERSAPSRRRGSAFGFCRPGSFASP